MNHAGHVGRVDQGQGAAVSDNFPVRYIQVCIGGSRFGDGDIDTAMAGVPATVEDVSFKGGNGLDLGQGEGIAVCLPEDEATDDGDENGPAQSEKPMEWGRGKGFEVHLGGRFSKGFGQSPALVSPHLSEGSEPERHERSIPLPGQDSRKILVFPASFGVEKHMV